MTVRALFTITAVVTLLLGLSWLFFPAFMLAQWGAQPNEMLVYVSRRYAVMFLGYSVMVWLARNTEPSATRRAILAGGLVVTCILAVVSLLGVVSGTINASGWIAFAIELLLTLGFGYFLLSKK
jgi:uncharacterized membrane protein (DUF441 family)